MLSLNLPLRTAQLVVTVALLAINGYVTHWYVKHTTGSMAPRATAFPLFVGGITLILLPYLFLHAPLQISHGKRLSNPRFFNKWVVLALDFSLSVLWFAAWIYECIFRATLTLCYGHVCGLMAWGAGLGAVVALLFSTATVLAALHVVRTRGKVRMPEEQTHDNWVGMDQKSQS